MRALFYSKVNLDQIFQSLRMSCHKKALLTNINESSLIEIQNQFNNIPRKVLGYKTLELFTKYLKRVALRT